MNDEKQATEGRKPPKKQGPRRKFSIAFKRKIAAIATRDGWQGLDAKYNLPSSSREWPKEFAPTKSGAAKHVKRANGALPLGPQREAIVYLKHAEKAFEAGQGRRGELLARLALATLIGDSR